MLRSLKGAALEYKNRPTIGCTKVHDAVQTYRQIFHANLVIQAVRLLNKDLSINAAVELHDSSVKSIVDYDGTLVVELTAYLHQSDGLPGVDPGTGWTRIVRLTFLNATMRSTLVKFPDTILAGLLTLSGEHFENCFAVPSTHVGLTRLHLEFANDIYLTIRGGGFEAECVGIPTYVEQFNP